MKLDGGTGDHRTESDFFESLKLLKSQIDSWVITLIRAAFLTIKKELWQ